MEAGGFDPGSRIIVRTDGRVEKSLHPAPNYRYGDIIENNKGEDVSNDITPSPSVLKLEKKSRGEGETEYFGNKYHHRESDNNRIENTQILPVLEHESKEAKKELNKIRGGG